MKIQKEVEDVGEIEVSDTKANSFKEVILSTVSKIINASNTEFRGGYYTIVETKKGEEKEIYIPDTRETFNNLVITLSHLLIQRSDKKMKESYQVFETDLERLKKDFITKSSVNEEIILGEGFYENAKDKILLETYKAKKLKLCRGLFSDMSQFLGRKNWFEIGGGAFQ